MLNNNLGVNGQLANSRIIGNPTTGLVGGATTVGGTIGLHHGMGTTTNLGASRAVNLGASRAVGTGVGIGTGTGIGLGVSTTGTRVQSGQPIPTGKYTSGVTTGGVVHTSEWADASHLGKVQSNVEYAHIPVEHEIEDYEDQYVPVMVPVKKKLLDYYTIETHYINKPRVRKVKVMDTDYQTKTEMVPHKRTEYRQEKKIDYLQSQRIEKVPKQVTEMQTRTVTDYVDEQYTDYVPVEKKIQVPHEVEIDVPYQRTEYQDVVSEYQRPVQRTEQVPYQDVERSQQVRTQYRAVEREEHEIEYVPVNKSVVKHPDGRVTSLHEAPRDVLQSVKARQFLEGVNGAAPIGINGPNNVIHGIPPSNNIVM